MLFLTHTHTHTHTPAHTHTHPHTHMHPHTHLHTYPPTYTHTHTHPQTSTAWTVCGPDEYEFQTPTPFRDRICVGFFIPSVAPTTITAYDLLADDSTTIMPIDIENPSLRNMTAVLAGSVTSLFDFWLEGASNGPLVSFRLRPRGNLDSANMDQLYFNIDVSDNFVVCRQRNQPVRQGPCIISVLIMVNVARLSCPKNQLVFTEGGATSAEVHFSDAVPSFAYVRYLSRRSPDAIIVPDVVNGSSLDVGVHQVCCC